MTDLHALFAAVEGMSAPELDQVRQEFARQFKRKPIAPGSDDELPDPTDRAPRPVSQTTGD